MNETGESIGELIRPFEKYFHSGEMSLELGIMNYELRSRGIIEKLKENYRDGEIDELDGITVEYPDWWFNLRPSNTEPVLRLVVEAKAQFIMEQKVKEITDLIRRFSV